MSRYLYKKIQNISPESLNFQHSGLKLTTLGSDSDILAWLFADTPKGAFANGVLYTLVESARANELDVYEYLKYLLTETPNNHHLEDPSVIDSLLPWSKELPEQCLLKRNRKKCLKH